MHEVFVHEFMSTMATLPARKMLAKVAPLALERANCVWASNKGLLHCTFRFLIMSATCTLAVSFSFHWLTFIHGCTL